jgi:hypothetical protein
LQKNLRSNGRSKRKRANFGTLKTSVLYLRKNVAHDNSSIIIIIATTTTTIIPGTTALKGASRL